MVTQRFLDFQERLTDLISHKDPSKQEERRREAKRNIVEVFGSLQETDLKTLYDSERDIIDHIKSLPGEAYEEIEKFCTQNRRKIDKSRTKTEMYKEYSTLPRTSRYPLITGIGRIDSTCGIQHPPLRND